MEDWKKTVIEEEKELNERIVKFSSFFNTDTFKNLDTTHKFLLERQYQVMKDYDSILKFRIERFS